MRTFASSSSNIDVAKIASPSSPPTTDDDADDDVINSPAFSSSNANPNEVQKFSSFASHWWDSRSNPLVGMNPIRIKFLRDVVDSFQPSLSLDEKNNNTASAGQNGKQSIIQRHSLPLQNKRVLDIGCGGGLLTESLSRLGASLVVGVDASTQVVEVAKRHSFHENSRLVPSSLLQNDNNSTTSLDSSSSSSRNIQYIGGVTIEELASKWLTEHEKELKNTTTTAATSTPPQHELFDIITALEIIEHVPNPSSLLHAAKSLLKPNGILLVSTINRTVKSYGLAIIAAEYISGKVPIGTHDWEQFWSPVEVEQMICGNDDDECDGRIMRMRQIALSGMVLQPPFVNMEWKLDGSDTDVNWIGAYQKQQV